MPEFKEDQDFWPIMLSLRDCLCEEIAASGLPPVCRCEVMPGAAPVYDFIEEGQAWVRLVSAFPSLIFPTQDQTPRNCATPRVGQFEVGIIRCAPMMSEGGDAPSAEEEFEAVRLQLADMQAMRRAIQCCMGKMKHVLGVYTPIGPEGGALGGTWQVWV